jgi:predicted transcriptional regulator
MGVQMENTMTQKQLALQAIERLPDSVTLEDIMAELYFRQKVERGLKDIEEGRVVTHEEARRRLDATLR